MCTVYCTVREMFCFTFSSSVIELIVLDSITITDSLQNMCCNSRAHSVGIAEKGSQKPLQGAEGPLMRKLKAKSRL